jgi:hypothetical protein
MKPKTITGREALQRWAAHLKPDQEPMKPRQLSVLDGHPVPFSFTLQSGGVSIDAVNHLVFVHDWLKQRRPDVDITRIDGAYVFYSPRLEVSVRSIDVGFDPREVGQAVKLPKFVTRVLYDEPRGSDGIVRAADKPAIGDAKAIAAKLESVGYTVEIE